MTSPDIETDLGDYAGLYICGGKWLNWLRQASILLILAIAFWAILEKPAWAIGHINIFVSPSEAESRYGIPNSIRTAQKISVPKYSINPKKPLSGEPRLSASGPPQGDGEYRNNERSNGADRLRVLVQKNPSASKRNNVSSDKDYETGQTFFFLLGSFLCGWLGLALLK